MVHDQGLVGLKLTDLEQISTTVKAVQYLVKESNLLNADRCFKHLISEKNDFHVARL